MTFLEIQNRLKQTKKARKGISNRRDYYEGENNNYEFDDAVYHKALAVANKIVRHYYDSGEINRREKISITFGDVPKVKSDKSSSPETEKIKKENQRLQVEVVRLKKEIAEFKNKFTHGGRKGYDDTMAQAVKMARERGETWRGLSKRLGISTTTAQKLYRI